MSVQTPTEADVNVLTSSTDKACPMRRSSVKYIPPQSTSTMVIDHHQHWTAGNSILHMINIILKIQNGRHLAILSTINPTRVLAITVVLNSKGFT